MAGSGQYFSPFLRLVAVALVRPDGRVVDQVGLRPYDQPTDPVPPYREGIYLSTAWRELFHTSGYARNGPDTNDNRADFTLVTPPPPQNLTACGPQPTAPGPASGLTASAGSSTVVLTWNAPSTGSAPTDYLIEAGSFAGGSNRAVYLLVGHATGGWEGGIARLA